MTDEAKAGVAVQELATAVADAVEQAIIGKREAVEMVLFALLADGHVLIEDLPGWARPCSPAPSRRCARWTSPGSSSPRT